MHSFFKANEKYFLIFLILSIFIGLYVPSLFIGFDRYIIYIIMAILGLLFMKVDIIDIVTHIKQPLTLLLISGTNLLLLPTITYFVFQGFDENILMAFVLLAALPTGVSSAVFTDIMKARTSLNLTIVVVSNLLAVFTIPLIFHIFFKQQMELDVLGMFINLVRLIIIPFLIAKILKRVFLKDHNQTLQPFYNPLIVLLLGFMIMVSISYQADNILSNWQTYLPILGYLFLLFFLLQLIGYFTLFWKSKGEKLAMSNSCMIMNNILGIVLALAFFNVEVLTVIILSFIPWNTLIIAKHWYKRFLP